MMECVHGQLARSCPMCDLENENARLKQELADTRIHYEELRKLIDGGSESMTHEDAVHELMLWRDSPQTDNEVDAARYRWLRDSSEHELKSIIPFEDSKQTVYEALPGGESLDAAIDAAMQEGKK